MRQVATADRDEKRCLALRAWREVKDIERFNRPVNAPGTRERAELLIHGYFFWHEQGTRVELGHFGGDDGQRG